MLASVEAFRLHLNGSLVANRPMNSLTPSLVGLWTNRQLQVDKRTPPLAKFGISLNPSWRDFEQFRRCHIPESLPPQSSFLSRLFCLPAGMKSPRLFAGNYPAKWETGCRSCAAAPR